MGYRGKLREQQEARVLRAQGRTLLEIADELGVAKSSVSLWVRDVAFEPRPRQRARRRAPNALQRRKTEEIERLMREGRERIGDISAASFLAAGAALYAGDGAKRDGEVRFANSNAELVAFFCRWLREFFEIDERRLRVRLYLHEGLDIDAAMQHWSRVTAVPAAQFNKPYRATADPTIRATKHVYGCAHVIYSCSATHRAVMGLIAGLLDAAEEYQTGACGR
jgi:transcriptional regulator with XRE-family HTH domain